MSGTGTGTGTGTGQGPTGPAEGPINNPPYTPAPGWADAPPPVPPEPNPDPETQAYLDAFVAPPDPRDAPVAMPTPEEYLAGFSAPDDPRDPVAGEPSPPPTDPPVNVDVPHVSQSGGTLNCTMGNWSGEPTSYAYAWHDDGTANGATGPDYAVQLEDSGHDFACLVTATNALGSTDAPMSNAVTVA